MTPPDETFLKQGPHPASRPTYTLAELRAAALALHTGAGAPPATALAESDQAAPAHPTTAPPGAMGVRVLAAHAGAGASTIALALADAAAPTTRARLIDAAAPEWSGLLNVRARDRGDHGAWRRAEREQLHVDRLVLPVDEPDAVPRPSAMDPPPELDVIDAGWSLRELRRAPSCWLNHVGDVVVLVARAHALGVRHAEHALRELEPDQRARVQLAVIGPRRQAALLRSAGGRCIHHRCDADALTWFPSLPHAPGERGPIDVLPRVLISAARQLHQRIVGQLHQRIVRQLPPDPDPDALLISLDDHTPAPHDRLHQGSTS